jgi:hypothetical protein
VVNSISSGSSSTQCEDTRNCTLLLSNTAASTPASAECARRVHTNTSSSVRSEAMALTLRAAAAETPAVAYTPATTQ